MNNHIFISRKLGPNSLFHSLKEKDFSIQDISLLDISPMPFDDFPDTDWIFFYSKNGVESFFEQLKDQQKELIKHKKFAVFGPKTNKQLKTYLGRLADYAGHGKGEEIVNEYLDIIGENSTILFVQAKHSKKTVQQHLIPERYEELTVYNNSKGEIPLLKPAKHNVFTSPLNVKYYFENTSLILSSLYYAIGESTYDALLEHVPSDQIICSKDRTEESLYKAVEKEIGCL